MPSQNIKKIIKYIDGINKRREGIQSIMQHGTTQEKCFINQIFNTDPCVPEHDYSISTNKDTSKINTTTTATTTIDNQKKVIDQLRNTQSSELDNPSYQQLYQILESYAGSMYTIEFDPKIKHVFENLILFFKQHLQPEKSTLSVTSKLYNIDKQFYNQFLHKILYNSNESYKPYHIKAFQCFFLCMLYPEECTSDIKHKLFFKKMSNLIYFSRIFTTIMDILEKNTELKKNNLNTNFFPRKYIIELNNIFSKLI